MNNRVCLFLSLINKLPYFKSIRTSLFPLFKIHLLQMFVAYCHFCKILMVSGYCGGASSFYVPLPRNALYLICKTHWPNQGSMDTGALISAHSPASLPAPPLPFYFISHVLSSQVHQRMVAGFPSKHSLIPNPPTIARIKFSVALGVWGKKQRHILTTYKYC